MTRKISTMRAMIITSQLPASKWHFEKNLLIESFFKKAMPKLRLLSSIKALSHLGERDQFAWIFQAVRWRKANDRSVYTMVGLGAEKRRFVRPVCWHKRQTIKAHRNR